jgi:hypothetical protein
MTTTQLAAWVSRVSSTNSFTRTRRPDQLASCPSCGRGIPSTFISRLSSLEFQQRVWRPRCSHPVGRKAITATVRPDADCW